MSSLYLIRHGQASFGAADYDVLSDLGIKQSADLGKYTAERPVKFDAVYTGPRKRQIDTAQHMFDAARSHGLDHPEPVMLEDFDEYPAFELIDYFMPIVSKSDPEISAALANNADAKTMDRLLKQVLTRWATGELVCDELESFAHFENRVLRGLRHVMETEGGQRTVAIVTSGGPISVAMKHTLDLPSHQTMRVGWTIANSSMTWFRYRQDEMTLHTFNNVEHLDDPSVTYR